MRITNKAGLPEPLVRAVMLDPYDASAVDYSTTTLIKPPRIVALERLHWGELEEDASDRLWALMGQLGHLVLERAAAMGQLAEKRFIGHFLGKKVGGQVDLLEDKILLDYKFTSVWAASDGVKAEWEQQHNINAALCRANGVQVTGAQIVAIYRDWSVGKARREADYPKSQVQVFDVKLWEADRQDKFIVHRVLLHETAKKSLPLCTDLDRWAKPDKWAVMKEGNKRALKLYDSQDEATLQAAGKQKLYVEHRPAEQTRCMDYCAVSEHCDWWKDYKKEHGL